jgi:rubrerythrin
MTPEELDAYERAHDETCAWCEVTPDQPCGWKKAMTALREAWAERDEWKNYHALRSRDLNASAARAEKAEAEAERLRSRLVLWTCPDCAFTFGAEHTDPDGGHSCPLCAENRARNVLRQMEAQYVEAAKHTESVLVSDVLDDVELLIAAIEGDES